MMSIHRVRALRAKQPYPESTYVELTFEGDGGESCMMVLYVDYPEFATALALSINDLPKAVEYEPPVFIPGTTEDEVPF